MGKLVSRTAVVTGGTKGIGRGIALALAAEGASVAVAYSRDDRAAKDAVAEIERHGGRALAVRADVSRADQVADLFARTVREFGPAHILVNNAAVFSFQAMTEITEEEFHRQYGTNVLGPVLTTRAFAEQAPAENAVIINVTTSGVAHNRPGSALYTSTKAALTTMTRISAKELAGRGIRVNALAPGATDTEGARSLGVIDSDMADELIAATPLGRIGRPEDVAAVALFLASDDSAWITGEVIHADGGGH
ncbi:SDR family NAD(P)-dependent oxidoreductase [Streptomyces sp. NPDC056672]|uniref:SDR family NAD(P)-dependent oxidoreductase n=1 Tax=Streptomyces sp. NPDC056672 TaxID=3345906 RepID=UPI003678D34F